MDPLDELAEHFAEYRARILDEVRPPGALAARRGYARRQQRRLVTMLAAFVALLLGAGTGAFALVDRHHDPGPGAHPTASDRSATPSPRTGESPHPAGPGSGTAPAGGPVPPGFRPVSVTFISTTSAWLLGSAPCLTPHPWSQCPAVLRSQDGGRTWVGVPAPGDAAYVGHIRFADARNGWIVVRVPLTGKDPDGVSGTLYATHDGGATWHRVPVPAVAAVEAAAGLVWVVTETEAYSAPVDSDTFTRAAATVGEGLAVHGRYAYLYGADGLVVVKDGTVTSRGLPCAADHRSTVALAAPADTRLAVVCGGARSGTAQPKQVYVSSDAGATWAPAGTPDGVGVVGSVAATSAATFLAGADMPVRVTRDGGRTWPAALAATDGFAYVGFTDDTHGVALPADGSAVYLTTDAGRTWTARQFP